MKKINLLAGSAMMALSFVALAPAAMAAADTSDFIAKAVMSDMFEIESSKLAVQKSGDPEVKAFAQQMISDHTKASADLKIAAMADGFTAAQIPTGLDEAHTKKISKLKEAKNGKDFDTLYTDDQNKAHDMAVSLFRDYGQDGDKANLKAFAQKTLPTLKMHEEMAEKLDAKY